MAMRILLLALCCAAGCSRDPVKPGEVAVGTVTRAEVFEVPVVAERPAAPELTAPLRLDFPELLDAGQGDYGLSRDSAMAYLRVLSAFRSQRQICEGLATP